MTIKRFENSICVYSRSFADMFFINRIEAKDF